MLEQKLAGSQTDMLKAARELSDGTLEDTVNHFHSLVLANDAFMSEAMPVIVKDWCFTTADKAMRSERERVLREHAAGYLAPNYDRAQCGSEMVKTRTTRLSDFRLRDGTPILEATPDQCAEMGDFYTKQGRTMIALGRWCAAVAKAAKGAAKVGDKITLEKLEELHEKTK